jgi:nicotinate-nucleotide adenylyltransferase
MPSIGIFGGTFDPPHIGHLILAAEALSQFDLDRVLWVLTPDPPHKKGRIITPLSHRLAMLKLALIEAPEFELSTVDIDRPGPLYAVDTVKILAAQNQGAEMVYLMGGDSLHDLPAWHQPADFIAACNSIGVLRRPGDEVDLPALEMQLPGLSTKVRFMDAPLLDIAARDIRERIATKRPYRFYLPAKVYDYIRQKNLYSTVR